MPRLTAEYSVPLWEYNIKNFESLESPIYKELGFSLGAEIIKSEKSYKIPTERNDRLIYSISGYWWSLEEGQRILGKLQELHHYKKVFGGNNELVKRSITEEKIELLVGK